MVQRLGIYPSTENDLWQNAQLFRNSILNPPPGPANDPFTADALVESHTVPCASYIDRRETSMSIPISYTAKASRTLERMQWAQNFIY